MNKKALLPRGISRYITSEDGRPQAWGTYLRLLEKHGLDPDFKLVNQYEETYRALSDRYYEESRQGHGIGWSSLFRGCTPRTLKEQIGNCKPRNSKKTQFSFPFTQQNYVIIIGFVAGFTAAEVNELLEASYLPTLHGRNMEHCAYIYCLNQHLSLEQYAFEVKPLMERICQVEVPPSVGATMNTLEDMQYYVKHMRVKKGEMRSAIEVTVFTKLMTDEIMVVDTQAKFEAYLENNKAEFAQYRNTPRFYLCDLLCRYIDERHITKNGDLTKIFNQIWKEFLEFYDGYVVTSIEDYEMNGSEMDDNGRGAEGMRKGEGNLLKYVQGTRPIPRKIFLLLLVFLGVDELGSLDVYCERCGFAVVDSDRPYMFDEVLIRALTEDECIENGISITVLSRIMDEIAQVNAYMEWLFLCNRIEKAQQKTSGYGSYILEAEDIEKQYWTQEEIQGTKNLRARIQELERRCIEARILTGAPGTLVNQKNNRRRYLENPIYLSSSYDL